MKKLLLVFLFSFTVAFANQNLNVVSSNETYLLPKESKLLKNEILSLIKSSKSEINIAMYNFSYKKIVKALISAAKKGTKIKVVFDKSKVKKDDKVYKLLRSNNIETIVAKKKLHTKIAVFDNKKALIGSMNWTKESFKNNYEVVVITKDIKLINKLNNFIKDF